MLRQFSLEGYRSFARHTSIRMAPITLLTGVNSVGKSSVIDMIGAIAQSRQENSGTKLRLRGTWVDLGLGDQVVTWRRSGAERRFSIGWAASDGTDVMADFEEDPGDASAALLTELEFTGSPMVGDFTWAPPSDGSFFRHPFASVAGGTPAFDLFPWEVLYLGPYRSPPQRLYMPRNSTQGPLLGADGTGAAETLHQRRGDHCDLLAPGQTIGAFVNRWWTHLFGMPLEARSSQISRVGFELSVDTRGAEGLGLGQVGLGLSQTLPIVLLAGLSKEGNLVAVQTPEAHLHPGAQHRTVDLFLELARAGRQVLLETHSEHLVNAVRLAVKRGVLAPADVSLNFFEQDDDGMTRVEEIEVDPQGRLARWPVGFFDQATLELGELLR